MKTPRHAVLRVVCACLLLPALFLLNDAMAQEVPNKPSPTPSISDRTVERLAKFPGIQDFIGQMASKHGFDRDELFATFAQVRHSKQAVQLVRPAPPSKPKNWQAYRARFVEPVRIEAGVRFWEKYARDLGRAEKQYGVPAEIIVAIIGVESIYGRHTGNFRVLDALTTLAFDYPETPNRAARMTFFRGEVEQTLLFARESGLDPLSLRGSYAGAIGWPQFMPSSIRAHGVDFDRDGKIDLRKSPADAIGSIANFLVRHGWKRGEPIVFRAQLGATAKSRLDSLLNKGLEATFWPADLEIAGVTSTVELPANLRFGLIDLQNGYEPTEYWLGTGNFFAITKYNRSYFYAMSVTELARAGRTAHNAEPDITAEARQGQSVAQNGR